MANVMHGSTFEIDTAGVIFPTGCWVRRLEWHPNAIDNDLIIDDVGYGENIWTVRAAAGAPNAESSGVEEKLFNGRNGKWYNGLEVITIDGGTLYIEVA